jgi:hypothetical protein
MPEVDTINAFISETMFGNEIHYYVLVMVMVLCLVKEVVAKRDNITFTRIYIGISV